MLLKMRRYWGLGILFLGFVEGNAQDSVFARTFIETLTATEMYGRNASHQGEWKAADFVAKIMQENQLKAFGNSYFQSVSYPNKAYSGNVRLSINGVFLEPLEDFIIAPESKCDSVCADAVMLYDSNFLSLKFKKIYKNKFLVVDLTRLDNTSKTHEKIRTEAIQWALKNKALGLIFIVDNFRSYRVAEFQNYKDLIIIEVKKTAKNPIGHAELVSASPVNKGIAGQARNDERGKICLTGKATYLPDYQTKNVIGYLEGREAKDSFVVITAHYDHLGTMGDNTIFYGANDNASGVALMLDLAKTLQKDSLKYTLVFIACCGEEMGLLGSKFFVENPLIDLSKVKMAINFDLLCAGDKGITVVNGLNHPQKTELLTKINTENKYLPEITPEKNAKNSDHYWFTAQNIPAFFIYAKGKTGKGHHPSDTCENCTLSGYNSIFKLFYQFIKELN